MPDPTNKNATMRCVHCSGSGRCWRCRDHFQTLESFARELEDGSPGSAEACLQRAMMSNVQYDQKLKSA